MSDNSFLFCLSQICKNIIQIQNGNSQIYHKKQALMNTDNQSK